MKKLIELGVAIDTAICAADEYDGGYNFERDRKIRDSLMALPTVDAVPVVRCADCIRFRPDDDVWGWCTVSGKMRCKDFCSYGVRKDGGDEQTKKSE